MVPEEAGKKPDICRHHSLHGGIPGVIRQQLLGSLLRSLVVVINNPNVAKVGGLQS